MVLLTGITVSAQTWLWGEQGGGSIKTDVTSSNLATNKTGNVYQTGSFGASMTFGSVTLTAPSIDDLYLVKYDYNGNVVWVRQSLSNYKTYTNGYSVASDDSDNTYVSGYTEDGLGPKDTVVFDQDSLIMTPLGYLFLVKYDANGNVKWVVHPNTGVLSYNTEGWAVAVDKFGHEYVTGDGAFLMKYDRDGNILWTLPQSKYTPIYKTYATSVATDNSGNVIISGTFQDSLVFDNYKLYSTNNSVFIAKFDSNGTALWAQQSTDNSALPISFNHNNGGNSVTIDQSGSAYLTGTFADTISFGSNTFINASTIKDNFFVVKYNPNGTIAWAKEATPLKGTAPHCCGAYSISSDDSNHIYIAGAQAGSGLPDSLEVKPSLFSFAGDTIIINDTDAFDRATFLLKLDSSGNVLCSSTLGAGGVTPIGIVSDSTGKYVYQAGSFIETFAIGVDTLKDYNGGQDTYIGRWQSCYKCGLTSIDVTPQVAGICRGQKVTLTASGGYAYTWSPSTGLNTTIGDTVIADPTATVTYIVDVEAKGGCTTTDTSVITVFPSPTVPTITISATGDSLISSASSYNQWYFNDVAITDSIRPVLVIKGHSKGWYFVQVTNPANGCSSNSDSTTSINQLALINDQLSVYPNPFNNSISIKINSLVANVGEWNLQITDVLGQTVYIQRSLNYSNEIDLSYLPGGIYFISILNKADTVVVPVVKQN